jgi:exosortase C (VPDSG-CTERM-specific)
VLVAAFAGPLWNLARYAVVEETASHILLVPFICLYLWRIQRQSGEVAGTAGTSRETPDRVVDSRPHRPAYALPALASGVLALMAWFKWGRTGHLPLNDSLALSTFSFYCLLVAAACAALRWQTLLRYRFPLAFLVFMVPLPVAITQSLSVALQYASAEASDVTLRLTGMPVFRDGLGFQLPGLRIYVAEECSGIRSTLVLFITSILAAHLFLVTRWKKIVFILCVFPIGVFRNALRITSISWLSVNVDSGIIDSAFHHRGGPVFFVLSLVPLFLLLWWFRKSDLGKLPASARAKR